MKKVFKVTLTLVAFLLSSQVVAATTNEIQITTADTVWTPSLTTVSPDVIDSTDAPPQTLSEAFVSHADTPWSIGLESWEALVNQPPTCVIKLQKDGNEIDEINLGEFFDIYVGGSTDDTGIEKVRFSSDESQNGISGGEWTEWYNWETSPEDWDASTKIKRWSFATLGDKEIWAEMKDSEGETDKCNADIVVHPGYAIIVAGKGGLKEDIWINRNANVAYRAMRNLGFKDQHIFYLNSRGVQDVDGDGDNEVDLSATLNNFKIAVNKTKKEMMNSSSPFVLYLVGHGDEGGDVFYFDLKNDLDLTDEDMLTTEQLNNQLAKFSDHRMLIMIDACYSGSFISLRTLEDSISATNRVVITSTSANTRLWTPVGLTAFSHLFWPQLQQGKNVKEAFIDMANSNLYQVASFLGFKPLLDDDGRATPSPPCNLDLGNDGELAATLKIGVPGSEHLQLTSVSWVLVRKYSPGELRVYDAQNRVTGLVDGEVKQEIPSSMYDEQDGVVAIFSPFDTYRYEVVGTDEGAYGLEIASIKGAEATTFTATDIPPSVNTIHQYTIDWDTLSQGGKGVALQIDEDGDGVFEQTIQADNTLQPPVANAGDSYEGNEGSPVAFDASDSDDSDGEITLYEWDFDGDGTYDAESTSPIIEYTWGDDYQEEITLRVTDDEGLTAIDTTEVTVKNVAPIVLSLTVETLPHLNQEIWTGDTLNFSGQFTDPGWLDTHTAIWDFGDGTSQTGILTEENEPPDATGQVTGSHIYHDEGTYVVALTVTDDDGGVGTDSLEVTVEPIPATIDCDPDTLDLKSEGKWITCYIELPEGYDVRNIETSTILLNELVPAELDPKYDFVKSERSYITDRDNDGILERMVKFDRGAVQEILEAGENVELVIVGKVLYNTGLVDFEGSEVIRVINK